jgi:hypothetical protein
VLAAEQDVRVAAVVRLAEPDTEGSDAHPGRHRRGGHRRGGYVFTVKADQPTPYAACKA